MKCIICGKGKAKRYCTAKKRNICARCCGEKRGIEINCPFDCEYFVEGQKHHSQKIMRQRVRKEGVKPYVRKAELYSKNPEVFAQIEIAIANSFRTNRRLNNLDLITALEHVYKTFETEESGIYYDYSGENTYANEISSTIIKILRESLQKYSSEVIDLEFVIETVKEFLGEAKFYSELDEDPQSYLIHLARYHPLQENENKENVTSGGIILTP